MAKHIKIIGDSIEMGEGDSSISTFAMSGSVSGDALQDQLRDTLIENGLITEVLYENNTNLIFSTPLSSKVIRLWNTRDFYHGDEWTSGTSITNSRQFTNFNTPTSIDIFYDNDFLTLQFNSNTYNDLVYIGKLSNGDEVAMGIIGSSSTMNYNDNNIYNITRSTTMDLVLLNEEFTNNGYIFKQDIYVVDAQGELIMDGDMPAKIVGLENVSITTGANKSYNLGTHFMTFSPLYAGSSSGLVGNTSLLIELDWR